MSYESDPDSTKPKPENSLYDEYDVLYSDTPLSFWGGVNPLTGVIIDVSHPLHDKCISNKVLCIPSGRGSCTGSQVLLELILNGVAPRAILLRDLDTILVTGGLIAEEFFKNEQVDNKKREKLDSHDSSSLIICSVNEKFSELEDYKTLSFIFDCNNNDENVKIKGGQDFEINTPNLLSKRYLNSDFSSTSSLKLTDDELSILHGRYTKNNKDIIISRAETLAMRVITKIASISNATKLIDVCSAHIDGVTFIGDGGLKFVQKLVEYGGKVKIPTTLNSQSVDRERWEVLGVEKSFALKANSVGDSYLKLGCHDSFTCAPYLLPSARPKYKQDIMWGESNAVVYSNSVIGARTEKYPDYFDILAALVGKVPYTGVHVTENRKPKIYLDVTKLVDSLIRSLSSNNEESEIESFFPTLGWLCGTLSDGKIPLILGLEKFKGSISDDHLKAFCAAFGSTGTAPLFHMVGVTPEASNYTLENHVTKIEISRDQLYHAYLSLDSAKNYDDNSKVDLIALGNPHLSIGEVRNLADLIKEDNRPKVKDVKVLTTLSRHILSEANKEGYTKILKDFGVTIISDTCWCMMTDPPIIPNRKDTITMTNSGKYAHYGPGLTDRRLRFASMKTCVKVAKGDTQNHLPAWLPTRSFTTSLLRKIVKR